VTGYDYTVPGSLGYSKGVFEWTQELSSINQLTEITVPADFLDREQDPGLPLPVGTTLLDMVHYADGRSYDIYHYSLPVSFAEFLEFYRDLAPTNGWTVSSIGVKEPTHYICDSEDCVVLNKGSEKMILYPYEGGIGADYYD
jgi:hypothetical protein